MAEMPTQRGPPWPDLPCTLPFWYFYLSVSFFGRHRQWLARLAIGGAYSCHHYASLTHSSILCLHDAQCKLLSCHWLGFWPSLSHPSTQDVPSNLTNGFFWIFQDSNRRTDVILCPCETFSPSTLGFFLSSASPALQPYQCFFHLKMRY